MRTLLAAILIELWSYGIMALMNADRLQRAGATPMAVRWRCALWPLSMLLEARGWISCPSGEEGSTAETRAIGGALSPCRHYADSAGRSRCTTGAHGLAAGADPAVPR